MHEEVRAQWTLSIIRVATANRVGRCEDLVLGLRAQPLATTTSPSVPRGGLVVARVLGIHLRHLAVVVGRPVLLQRPDDGLGARHRVVSTVQTTWWGLDAAALFDDLQEDPQ